MQTQENIRAALECIPASDREMWLRMGMALKSELADDGFDLWDDWSQQDESYNERDAKAVWRSIRPNGRVTIGTLIHEARRHGYTLNGDARSHGPAADELLERKRRADEGDAERARGHAEAQKKAIALWTAASPASDDHPYLKRKQVKAHGIRRNNWPQRSKPDSLLVPMYDGAGELRNLQAIFTEKDPVLDRDKDFLAGGKTRGCYHTIGEPDSTICIAEGFATGASIHEATGHAVVIAFSSGNLEPVAKAIRTQHPDARIIVCADNDQSKAKNSGLDQGRLTAQAVGGDLAYPEREKDFNDMTQACGMEVVRSAIANAKSVSPTAHQSRIETAAAGREWPEPQPIPEGLPRVAAFDFALLPETLQPWASDICERVQCAPDFVGVAVMAGLGSVIGRKLGIRPQVRTDWTVTPNQWALSVGRPGVLKSPAMETALSPLKRLAAHATETHKAAMQNYQTTAKLAKLKSEAGEKSARAALQKDKTADVVKLLSDEEVEVPALKRYIANDSTAAALGELLRQNHNGVLVFRDEMVSLLKSLDREDNAEARGFYLTGWNGDSSFTFDRIGRGLNLHIPAVCLSLLGSTQPGRIAEYLRTAVRGGAGDDGLIQRFGLLVWPDTSGEWRDCDRWPDGDARREANRVFELLDRLDVAAIGAQQDKDANDDLDGIPFLRFDDAGHGLFLEWRSDLEAKLHSGDLHPALESHLAKYRKLVPSLALICHVASRGSGKVTGHATLQALAWAEYLETHARRAYASVTSSEVDTAKAIIQRLRKGDLPQMFSSWHVWRPGWAMLSDREQVTDALKLLVDLDWLSCNRQETGGRTATVYSANPKGLRA